MATVTKGRTFTSGETVTPAKLNDVVDLATVTEIVNADIKSDAAVALSKLATGALPTAITVATDNIVDANVTNDKLSLSANAGEIKKALNADNSPPIFACRAWVNFDATKDTTGAASTAITNRLIRASGNVASVIRNGAGDYTVTFSTAMIDGNYSIQLATDFRSICGTLQGSPPVASLFRYRVQAIAAGTETNIDREYNFVSIFR
jgi:hypothetical protein